MSIMIVEKPSASKISQWKTPGLSLKCMYGHNIILFCNYYIALLKIYFFHFVDLQKCLIFGVKKLKKVFSSEPKQYFCGVKTLSPPPRIICCAHSEGTFVKNNIVDNSSHFKDWIKACSKLAQHYDMSENPPFVSDNRLTHVRGYVITTERDRCTHRWTSKSFQRKGRVTFNLSAYMPANVVQFLSHKNVTVSLNYHIDWTLYHVYIRNVDVHVC